TRHRQSDGGRNAGAGGDRRHLHGRGHRQAHARRSLLSHYLWAGVPVVAQTHLGRRRRPVVEDDGIAVLCLETAERTFGRTGWSVPTITISTRTRPIISR